METSTASAKPHILVVDDEADMVALLQDLLRKAGFEADGAGSGDEARRAMAARAYELMLLDLRLKHEDGLTLARQLRQSSRMPIIMISGSSDETDRVLLLELAAAQKLEVLGQLTGGVAHDFNNYLGTILGNLALLEGDLAASPKAHAQWQRVQRAASSAAGLTRRLLAFARRQPLQAEDVAIDEMIEEMRDLIEYSAGSAVGVSFELAAAPLRLHVDRGQLENALLNLVMNSAAAMPDGGRLEVRTQRIADADGTTAVELRVSDSGSGMPEALTAKVFEPFFTTKAAGEGSGLGLSIVYGFVKQSGGNIALASRPGAGTTVTLVFPAMPPGECTVAPRATPAPRRDSLAGLRLLVVEDDDAFRATLGDMLAGAHAEVRALASAEQALAALRDGAAPSLLLSDICLGAGLDGLRLARAVRTQWPELPVLLMSGLSPELFANHSEWTGDFPFLQKPFAIEALAASLRQALVASDYDDVSRLGQHSQSEVHRGAV